MRSYLTARLSLARRAAAAGALAALSALAAGCGDTADSLLSVTDPDIINPNDVRTPAGAAALRNGALARLAGATSGIPTNPTSSNEGIILLGGLLADEWRAGDSFIARDEIDARTITRENTFVTGAVRAANRARLSAAQAIEVMRELEASQAADFPEWQLAQMYFVQGYIEILLTEHFCSGVIFSDVVQGVEKYGSPMTTEEARTRALAHVDSGLALVPAGATDSALAVRHALSLVRGRILVQMGRDRLAEAAAAVAGVPTSYRFNIFHTQVTSDNAFWAMNNNSRRYSLGNGEGVVGINFATTDPRVPNTAPANTLTDDRSLPLRAQQLWPQRTSTFTLLSGVEARLIEAEAQLEAGNGQAALDILNALRAPTGAGSGGVTGLAALTLQATPEARVDQLFRERAFWLFGRGYRLGDMRRLVRQYQRSPDTVFPRGAFHKNNLTYGTDMNFPIPQAEENNPEANGAVCLNRDA